MAELVNIHPEDPELRKVVAVSKCLMDGGVIVFPTDSVYAFGCSLNHPKAIDRLAQIKGVKREQARFSILCGHFSQVSEYTKHIDTDKFKIMKKALPGPYTFILEAGGDIPAFFKTKRRQIGIRIPKNNIAQKIVELLGIPIVCTSVLDDDKIIEHIADPELIMEKHGHEVDMIVDGGSGHLTGSTVIDLTGNEPVIVRPGAGDLDIIS